MTQSFDSQANRDSGVRRNNRNLRMVTLLIVDVRSGQEDHQLAEVKVPLRAADPPDPSYWVNAKDVSDSLQASASRIEGMI